VNRLALPADATDARPPASEHADERRWVDNEPSGRWFPGIPVAELWGERELALILALKDLKLRYKQTFFGVAWVLLQPLVAVLIFSLVFGRAAGLPTDGIPYPVFAYTGLTLWFYFTSAVTSAAQCLLDNKELVAKVYFPRLLAPIASMLPGLVDLAVSLPVIAVFLAIWTVAPGLALLTLPLWVLATVVTALGVGLLLAGLNVRYRDVRFVLGFLIQAWLFATPVVYSISLIKGSWRYVYALNPMASIVAGFRWSIAGGPAPGLEVLVSGGVVVVLLAAGFLYFTHVERSFADVI
jgi:lipopolysaccharide transport system permease protein